MGLASQGRYLCTLPSYLGAYVHGLVEVHLNRNIHGTPYANALARGSLSLRPLGVKSLPSAWLLILLCLFAVGCGNKNKPVVQPPPEVRTVTVEVPTFVKAMPPAELLTPFKFPLPVFISPFDPKATSALDAEGERTWRGMIEELLQRIKAWETWAATP